MKCLVNQMAGLKQLGYHLVESSWMAKWMVRTTMLGYSKAGSKHLANQMAGLKQLGWYSVESFQMVKRMVQRTLLGYLMAGLR